MTPPIRPQSPDRASGSCVAMADAIFDRAAGALGPLETARLEAHLVGCAACRELAGELATTEDTARALMLDLAGPEAVPPALAHGARSPGARSPRASRRPLARRLAWAAGLLAATGLGIAQLWPQTSRTDQGGGLRAARLARVSPPAPSARAAPATPLAAASDTLRLALADAFAVPE